MRGMTGKYPSSGLPSGRWSVRAFLCYAPTLHCLSGAYARDSIPPARLLPSHRRPDSARGPDPERDSAARILSLAPASVSANGSTLIAAKNLAAEISTAASRAVKLTGGIE